MQNNKHYLVWTLFTFMMWIATCVSATEMVYTPINPSFGGNPNNAPGLLSIAQVQNSMRAPVVVSTNVPLTAVEKFSASLNNLILNRLASETMVTLFGPNSSLEVGTHTAGNFIVTVTELPNGNLQIETRDKTNKGAPSIIEISQGSL
jgi:curli production assembly/transport component CsgF